MKRREPSRNSFQVRFGRLVRRHRIDRGLTLQDVARLAYNNEERASVIADVESGRFAPGADKIDRFRAALEIPLSAIEDLLCEPPWPRIVSTSVGLDRVVAGRDDNVAQVREAFSRSNSVAIVPGLVLNGAAGVGKTTLARYYVNQYREHYHGIWWLRAESRQTLLNDFCELAPLLGIASSGREREPLARAVLGALQSSREPWLLVFDNAQAPQDLREWRPENGDIDLLITSRSGHWPSARYGLHRTDVLDTADATDLLMREANRSDGREAAENLATALDRLPLTLVVAGGWLRDRPSVPFDAYAEQIDGHIADLPPTLVDYPYSIAAAINLSISGLSPSARAILNIVAFLAPDRFETDLLGKLAEGDVPEERFAGLRKSTEALLRDRGSVEAALAELERISLIDKVGARWRIHRTAQAVTRATLAEAYGYWLNAAASLVAASYPKGGERNPQFARNWAACEGLNPHVESLYRLRVPGTSGENFEHIFNQAALYFWKQEAIAVATRYALAVVRSLRSRPSPSPRDLGEAYNNLAAYLASAGKATTARSFSARAIEISQKAAQVPDADRAIWNGCHGYVLNEIALASRDKGRTSLAAQSRRFHHRALALHSAVYGKRSRQAGIHLRNIGKALETVDRPGAAFVVQSTALSIRRRSLPADDPDPAISLLDVGSLLLRRGKVDGAGPLLREALSIFEATYASNARNKRRLQAAGEYALFLILSGNSVAVEELVLSYSGSLDRQLLESSAALVRKQHSDADARQIGS